MIGTLITMVIGFMFFGLIGGVLIGKLLWTPPAKGVK